MASKDAYFNALEQINISLNQNDKMTLKRKFIESGGLLPIIGLVKNLTINNETHEWEFKNISVLQKINMSLGIDRARLKELRNSQMSHTID